MFAAEYGSFRGYLPFQTVFRYYPPYEHAVTMLAVILCGYAIIRYYLNIERFSRFLLVGGFGATVIMYLLVAFQWVNFLDSPAILLQKET